ncbi:ABC-type Fe3+-hydroxamate transport system, periplasmic component [Halobacteroides halobius DSM 5150]|uniref:ABC-type Fe3+-hydroxamate transport system, periplasmic component n=1 Tax=Halobacteroides halobius (strain ATCC 35273 / DSM 5150 / MD-1) TaxID=748449 RepID=L0KB88_HALHC|nr:cobalamin-binding protein [Halobacteroides halobius]AGB41649.1 ABC-type Fe3+-hydroxamate transport system, periplasmic component [Halobacteroides halobius DSM 5150]
MKLKKNLVYLLVLISLLVGGSIVQATDYPITVTDDLKEKVTIDEQPKRIISLAPSNTEILFALGLEDKVVGVTKHADYPQAATKKKQVSSKNLETIIQLKPDLVLAAGITSKEMVKRLRQLGIKVIGLNPKTIKEIIASISLVGKITGQQKKARKLTTRMQDKINKITETIKEHVSQKQRPEVFYEVWKQPLYTAGPNTFIDNLISLAGGVNIAHDAQSAWPQYSFEVLLAKNPDVYLASKHSWKGTVTKRTIMNRDEFASIKAIREGRVHILNPDIVNRPGPRIVIALEKIAKVLHPKLFSVTSDE